MTQEFIHIVLPAGPSPKQLTARAPIKSLGEHYLAFLAMHNNHKEVEKFDTVSFSVLFQFAAIVQGKTNLTKREAQIFAHSLSKTLNMFGVDTSKCMDLVAAMAGYKNWNRIPTETKDKPFPVVSLRYLNEQVVVDISEAKAIIKEYSEDKLKVEADLEFKKKNRKQVLKQIIDGDINIFVDALKNSRKPWLLDKLKEYQLWVDIPMKQVVDMQRAIWKVTEFGCGPSQDLVAMVLGYKDHPKMKQDNTELTVKVLPPLLKFPE